MRNVNINISIEDGIVVITDNLGNTSSNDLDPEITISDQIGTYVTDHIENHNIYSKILSEGIENADYMDDDDFDELDD